MSIYYYENIHKKFLNLRSLKYFLYYGFSGQVKQGMD